VSEEPQVGSVELAGVHPDRSVDPIEMLQARNRAHAALFGESLSSGQFPPIQVDRYQLISKAGSGGLGTVWKAHDPKLDREVAIKLLRRDRLRTGERARKQLMAEAALMARIAHPNVVRVYDVGEAVVDFGPSVNDDKSQLFIVMEFVDGKTLRRWQAEGPHGVAEVLAVYSQAAAGLIAAHEANLVHGDFKPDNVLIDDRGRVLVTDFAVTRNIVRDRVEYELSTLESPSESERNRVRESVLAAVIVGTPAYMSPEQLDGEVPDARSDQFGFCVALWEAVTGDRPFPGRTFAALREAIAAGPPPFPAGVGSARLRSVLAQGLAENPEDRHPSLQALLAELGRLDRPRMPRLAAVGGLMVVAGLGVLVVVPQLRAVEPASGPADATSCVDEAEQASAAVWSATQIDALKTHWVTLPTASHTFEQVEGRLNTWQQSWRAASQSACEAHHAGALTGEPYHLRMACLDRNLRSFAVLVGLLRSLGTANATALANVGEVLTALPDVDTCSDPIHAAHLAAEPSFDDASQQQAFADALESLERAEYLHLLHEFNDALALLEPILGLSESLGWDAGRARALFLRGSARIALGETKAGEDDLFEATVAARRAGRADIEAEALIDLALQALDNAAYEDSKRWIDLASTAIEADDNRALRVKLAVVRGLLANEQGELETARAEFEGALATADLDDDPKFDHSRLEALINLGSLLTMLGELDEAKPLLERARTIGVALRGPTHPEVGVIYHSLGGIELAAERPQAALALFEAAHAITVETRGEDNLWSVIERANIAEALAAAGRCEEAREWVEGTVTIGAAVLGRESAHYARVVAMRGSICSALEPKAIEYMDEALAILAASEMGAQNPLYATFLSQRGFIWLARGEAKKALADFEAAATIDQAMLPPDHPDRVKNEQGLARARKALE
jgi:tetratricopeptide (TPR) repeat protein